jgi:hypothetical protein
MTGFDRLSANVIILLCVSSITLGEGTMKKASDKNASLGLYSNTSTHEKSLVF